MALALDAAPGPASLAHQLHPEGSPATRGFVTEVEPAGGVGLERGHRTGSSPASRCRARTPAARGCQHVLSAPASVRSSQADFHQSCSRISLECWSSDLHDCRNKDQTQAWLYKRPLSEPTTQLLTDPCVERGGEGSLQPLEVEGEWPPWDCAQGICNVLWVTPSCPWLCLIQRTALAGTVG